MLCRGRALWCLFQLHAIPVFWRIKGEVLVSVRGSEGGCGPPALAPAKLAAQNLPRASQKPAPHVLLSRTSCDTNQPCAPAQLHCCTTAVPHCSSSSGSLGLCLHARHTPAALSPASQQGSRHCLYSDPSTGDPPLPPPSLSTLVMEKLTYSPLTDWWVPALPVLLRACWGQRENCSQVPFSPRTGLCFQP